MSSRRQNCLLVVETYGVWLILLLFLPGCQERVAITHISCYSFKMQFSTVMFCLIWSPGNPFVCVCVRVPHSTLHLSENRQNS